MRAIATGYTYINGSGDLVFVEVDLAHCLTGDQVEVASLTSDRAIVAIRRTGTRLVYSLERDWTVECSVRIAVIGLRLCLQADAVPTAEEVVCINRGQSRERAITVVQVVICILTDDGILKVREA